MIYRQCGATVSDGKKKRTILPDTENDPHSDAKHTAPVKRPGSRKGKRRAARQPRGNRRRAAVRGLRFPVRQFDLPVPLFKVRDVPAQQVQNLSGYGAAVVLGDILQLIVQFPVNVQTEVLVLFHFILTSSFE